MQPVTDKYTTFREMGQQGMSGSYRKIDSRWAYLPLPVPVV